METEQDTESRSKRWQKIIVHEMFEYGFNFVFLAMFLVAFAWYRRLVLAAYHIQYHSYWMPVIEAAILAKVIMLGDALHVGSGLRSKPRAVVTIYRTLAFSLFVAAFTLVEHIVEAMIHGRTATEGISEIANKGIDEILASCLLVLAAFLPFFAMKEIERAFGARNVRELFFRGQPLQDDVTGRREIGTYSAETGSTSP